jgi:hypothetical protein
MERESRASEPEDSYSVQHQTSTGDQRESGDAAEQQNMVPQETLLPPEETIQLWDRWQDIQAGFVDDPRGAVADANGLVDEVSRRVIETFTRARTELENQWSHGDEVTTEELRVTLQRYRSFFEALLTGRTSQAR